MFQPKVISYLGYRVQSKLPHLFVSESTYKCVGFALQQGVYESCYDIANKPQEASGGKSRNTSSYGFFL